MKKILPATLVLLSGFAGLVYQLLWMRQLGLLFGNTAYAAGMTLAVFFGGLAAGSWFLGRKASKHPNPLRLYAWIELGIFVTAAFYFVVMQCFRAVYPAVYQGTDSELARLAVKLALAVCLVFPPAFFMGGTLPAMGQYLVHSRNRFGIVGAWMYGVNTLGAAAGAMLAAFILVRHLGFHTTCIFAMAVTGLIAAVAAWFSRRDSQTEPCASNHSIDAPEKPRASIGHRAVFILSFLSGFSVLALEVLWTRMLAQVHENSVYSFATVLTIVLACLSLGALLSGLLARSNLPPRLCLSWLVIAGGAVVTVLPAGFVYFTDNIRMLPASGSFAGYVGKLLLTGLLTIGPGCLLLGMVFPYLMKNEEQAVKSPGRTIGNLLAVNTTGAILGSLLCAFLLIRVVGMWWTVFSIGALYLLIGVVLPGTRLQGTWLPRVAGIASLVLSFTLFNPSGLPVVGMDPGREHRVIESWETSSGMVAVVEGNRGALGITLNSNYALGSTEVAWPQIYQARIPLFAWPDTSDIYFLGLGTGITVGGALDTNLFPSVERVVACELVPEIITAARKYIAGGTGRPDYTQGAFVDGRVRILAEDGRHYLMASGDTFDMINADLFLPYRSGAGSLYSREHFETARKRLEPGGVFVQWLPMFQLTDREFGTICRTMLSVFDQVTMWRNSFLIDYEVVALVGHAEATPMPSCDIQSASERQAFVRGKTWRDLPSFAIPCREKDVTLFYCGNVTASSELFESYPVNTDDRPVIEYAAPLSMHQQSSLDAPSLLIGTRLADLVDTLLANCPPDEDPVLQNRAPGDRRLPLAGAALYRAYVAFAARDATRCEAAWNVFRHELTGQSRDKTEAGISGPGH